MCCMWRCRAETMRRPGRRRRHQYETTERTRGPREQDSTGTQRRKTRAAAPQGHSACTTTGKTAGQGEGGSAAAAWMTAAANFSRPPHLIILPPAPPRPLRPSPTFSPSFSPSRSSYPRLPSRPPAALAPVPVPVADNQ